MTRSADRGDPGDAQYVQFRPHKACWVAGSVAAVLFGVCQAVAVSLRSSETGLNFGVSDQVAMGLLGLVLALAMLMFARPRVRADAETISVRNVLFGRSFEWREILSVSFPDGASFARLELPHDEYYSVLAVQAIDRHHAVDAVRTLRKLHRGAAEAAETTGTAETAETANENEPAESDTDGRH